VGASGPSPWRCRLVLREGALILRIVYYLFVSVVVGTVVSVLWWKAPEWSLYLANLFNLFN
jgi:hypothetical protein